MRDKVTRLYVSGPMTGIAQFNYPEFHRVTAALRAAGYDVENPAENPEPPCGTYSGYLRQAIVQVTRSDALAYLDGWEASNGAHVEIRIARDLQMPLKHWRAWLAETGN